MAKTKPLEEQYHDLISTWIDEKGVYPHKMLSLDSEGRLTLSALDLKPPQAIETFLAETIKAEEVIFGLDRFTRDGQGTTLSDVITCVHFRRETPDTVSWRPGIIEYQHEPRIVKPWNWENRHWNGVIMGEIDQVMALRVRSAIARGVQRG
jgi:hypothetical protein